MGERFRTVLGPLRKFWAGLSAAKRILLAVATAGVLLGTLLFTWIGSRIDYGYLFTELAPEDAAAILEKLEQKKVPYRLEAQGTAIQVPRNDIHKLRIEMAKEGVPRGGAIGFELFDRSQIGATEFEQQVSLKRALEGELARTISSVEGVKSARVHLVLPERRLFASRDESASASVVLRLTNPDSFGKREVTGIVHLVAAAVPGLTQDRVSVVSSEGLTLHRPVSGGKGGELELADLQAEQGREIAAQLEGHVREQLERVVGPGNADIRIHVMLDQAARERTEEHYEPTRTALRSEQKVEETSGAEGATVAGVPGALTNVPDAKPSEDAQARGNATGGGAFKRSHTRNWEVDRVTEKTVTPPGGVRRISVAVLVNGSYRHDNNREVYVPRSKAELEGLESIVKRAVGFDAERGDQLSLRNTEFARVAAGEAPEPPRAWWQTWLTTGVAAGMGVSLLVTLSVLTWRVRRRRRTLLAMTPALAATQNAVAGELVGARGTPELMQAEVDAIDLRTRALELAAKDPATAAIVLRNWLHATTGPTVARS